MTVAAERPGVRGTLPTPVAKVWVRPNRSAIGLAALLVAMWYAGVSQSNGAAYLLCFVISSVALVSTIHSWVNLRGLQVDAGLISPAFSGEVLRVPLLVRSTVGRTHLAIRFKAPMARVNWPLPPVLPLGEVRAEIEVPSGMRGCYDELVIRMTSLYPLGFFTASTTLRIGQRHYIYPQAEGALPLPRNLAPSLQPRDGVRVDGDDFAGVRAYQIGESQRHIDWKAAARGQPLLIKQWAGEADTTIWLGWDDLPDLSPEKRLSQLAQWIVQAERRSISYGLTLPGLKLAPEHGTTHFHECLRALAVHPRTSVDS